MPAGYTRFPDDPKEAEVGTTYTKEIEGESVAVTVTKCEVQEDGQIVVSYTRGEDS